MADAWPLFARSVSAFVSVFFSAQTTFRERITNRKIGNRTSIVRLTSIELNQTHPKILTIEHNHKILPIEHNRTFENRTLQQSNIKPVSSGFKQGIAFK